jgi:xylulokinase
MLGAGEGPGEARARERTVYLGIDLGTSAVKVVLVDFEQSIVASEMRPLEVRRPRALWSEQDPESWWRATVEALDTLAERPGGLAAVRGVGLSGQMHGATLLDSSDRVLRPAILWNDGRSGQACLQLRQRVGEIERITGNLVMPGFTAPKLVWLAEHEPEVFQRVAHVLLPKDFLRLQLTGDHATEMSDASGTLWLDVARRSWSTEVVEACGLTLSAMPELYEGTQATGVLRPEWARRWGMSDGVRVAGGAGDQAAGAAGAGAVAPGQGLLSLGTSGVLFVAGDTFSPNPQAAVHAFCHCLPARWHQMSVILSAAASLSWVVALTGRRDEAALLEEIERSDPGAAPPIFLPYLSGERTPHNDPHAQGVFFGLTHDHGPAALGRAVLEGVAFAMADGQEALAGADGEIRSWMVLGGGARSPLWGGILASVLDRPLTYTDAPDVGPAFGAARLARIAETGEDPETICTPPPTRSVIEPDPVLRAGLDERRATYRSLYPRLREVFARNTGAGE